MAFLQSYQFKTQTHTHTCLDVCSLVPPIRVAQISTSSEVVIDIMLQQEQKFKRKEKKRKGKDGRWEHNGFPLKKERASSLNACFPLQIEVL